ncbi:heterogeneous nuclear ribonucleoprotein 1-like isoform X1 [Gastrolobium bilobum]|uniref:heterogeneous nuclear ribonucleoprotein 1-like isoform X1 n=1 Tax=Gastrolobium bilobum TaxID=150636 RepID=UPI002AB2F943|nr:heterogeneous nuclear ribonucleoprotein 1-like isoform X1 [Gastrolobium bilobum]
MNLKMDSDRAKLFVGGISRDTNEDILKHHFAKYGTVSGSTISIDRSTRSPRGFGFVTFSDLSAADKALQDSHVILGRTVEVKKAIPRNEQQHQNQLHNRGGSNYISNDCSSDNIRTKKIFVGGLPAGISEEEFRKYFERFGRITDVVVMQDSVTHRPRGFGFITFDSEESVQSVMVKSFHDLNGRQVEVKRAVPKDGNHVYEGFNKLRYKSERGVSKSFPHYSPRNMLPGFAPMPWYGSDGVYAYGTNTYGCWYPMGGYGGNGYAVPSDASRNFWYGPMITGPQTCQVPYANASPSFGYVGGRVGMVGNGAGTWGYNGILGSATNLKFDQPFNANGFVPGNVRSPQGVKQDVDSSSFKGSNGEISS